MAIQLKNAAFGDTIVTKDPQGGYQFDGGVHIEGGSDGFTVEVPGSFRLGFTADCGFSVGVTSGDDLLHVDSCGSIQATASTSGGITANVGDAGFLVELGPGFDSTPAFHVVAQSGPSLIFADRSGNVWLPQGFTLGSGIDYGIDVCGDVCGRYISASGLYCNEGRLYIMSSGNNYAGTLQDVTIPNTSGGSPVTYKVLVFTA